MKESCIAKNCGYLYQKNVRIKVFRFPDDKERCAKWRENMRVPEDNKPSSIDGICEQHFLKKCFYDFELGSRLKDSAVPTLLQLGARKAWRKVVCDYEALDDTVQKPPDVASDELRARVEQDHCYQELMNTDEDTSEAEPLKVSNPRKRKIVLHYAPGEESALKEEIAEMKQKIHSQNIQMKRLEEKLKRRDQKKQDLDYAVDKLKSVLQCCECGMKPESESELAKMLKRKKNEPESSVEAETPKPPRPNKPTQVVCRSDLVVGLTWKQLFTRINSMSHGV